MSIITKHILVADIGGTNARFAVADFSSVGLDGVPEISGFESYPCADFQNPAELIGQYISDHAVSGLDAACFAVAGPVTKNKATLTNLGWKIEGAEIEERFGIPKAVIANDFQALARSVTALDQNELLALHETQTTLHEGPISVMGPGTGFGLALVLIGRTTVTVAPTEGGHTSFVPHGDSEAAVFQEVHKSMGRVTIETFMSGIGILRIYRAVCSLRGIQPRNYEPSTISQQALENGEEACVDTLNIFCSMLGGIAADIALTQGAVGGVYLGGGILPKIGEFLAGSNFVERFLDKPPMNDYIAKIPVNLITDPKAALIGASLLAIDS